MEGVLRAPPWRAALNYRLQSRWRGGRRVVANYILKPDLRDSRVELVLHRMRVSISRGENGYMDQALATLFAVTVGFGLMAVFGAGTASAQAPRTWVSGVGDDANPCSRTALCKTFAGAIAKAAAGGEISLLDPGGLGAVTITKSISIVADGNERSILSLA